MFSASIPGPVSFTLINLEELILQDMLMRIYVFPVCFIFTNMNVKSGTWTGHLYEVLLISLSTVTSGDHLLNAMLDSEQTGLEDSDCFVWLRY